MDNRDDSAPEIILQAKAGSVANLSLLPTLLPTHSTTHHRAILDAIFENLKLPSDDIDSRPLTFEKAAALTACYFALTSISRWLAAQPPRSPTALSMSLRLTQGSSMYIYWACEMLKSIKEPNTPLCKELQTRVLTALAMHSRLSEFFATVFGTHTTIYNTLVKEWGMIEVIIRLWTVQPTGQPPIYADRVLRREDRTVALLDRFTKDNPEGVAQVISDGGVCPPEVFLKRTLVWMSVLNRVVLVRHLSHLQVIYHETENIQHIVFATSRLMESDLELRARIMAGPLPGTYMEALLMLSTVLNAESLQELHGRRFEGLPPPVGRSPQNEIDLKAVLPILEQIIGWNMSTSSGIPGGVKQLIVNGAIKILGHSVHLRHGDGKHAALLDHLFAVLDEYAVYPKIITVLEAAVKTDLETRLGRPEKDHRKVREFARSTKDTKLVGLAYAGAPLQYVKKKNRISLCDNLKHCDRTNAPAKFEGKLEDWNTLHRHECTEMYFTYIARKAKDSDYSQGTRAYQTSLMRYGFETYASKIDGDNYAIKGSCGRDSVIDVDPLRDENTRSRKLGHYLLETTPLIPPHLRQRFNSLIDTFTSTNRSTYRGSTASKVPAQSARLVERGFRFGDQDINVLLLLRGVKKVRYDNSLVALNRSVGEGFRTRAITTPSMFEVCGSLIYMSPTRKHVDVYGGTVEPYAILNQALNKRKRALN